MKRRREAREDRAKRGTQETRNKRDIYRQSEERERRDRAKRQRAKRQRATRERDTADKKQEMREKRSDKNQDKTRQDKTRQETRQDKRQETREKEKEGSTTPNKLIHLSLSLSLSLSLYLSITIISVGDADFGLYQHSSVMFLFFVFAGHQNLSTFLCSVSVFLCLQATKTSIATIPQLLL